MTQPIVPTELTLRDVLAQIDRRLSLIEADQRSLDGKLDNRLSEQDGKLEHRLGKLDHRLSELDDRLTNRVDELRSQMDQWRSELLAKIDSRFAWTLTTMVTIGGLLLAAIKL